MDRVTLAGMIDQTLLRPTAGFSAAAEWFEAARTEGFATVCVSPFLVPLAAQRLAGTSVGVCSVVGFPFGYALTETKVEETEHLIALGCAEIDMVMNIAAFLEGETRFVLDDMAAVVDAAARASDGRALVKVIIETGHLDEEQIAQASGLVAEAGAAFVKTSTGFGPRGASVRDVEIIRAAVGNKVGIKAAGGIRDLDTALALIDAGATRLGTSAGLEILAQATARGL